MSTLQFDKLEIKSIFTLISIDNLAKELSVLNNWEFKLAELKDKQKIQGSLENLKLLQLKLLQAKLPTGEITG